MLIDGIRIVPNTYGESDPNIDVKGCYSFVVYNLGTVKAYIWGTVELLPNESVSFPNIDGMPYAENAPIEFSGSGTKQLLVIKAIKVKMTCDVG